MGHGTNADQKSVFHLLDALLVAWLVLIGADRIDFFMGNGGFVLTPFLILSPLVVTAIFYQAALGRPKLPLKLPRSLFAFSLIATALIATILISVVLGSGNELGIKRACFLMVQIYTTILVAIALHNAPALQRALLLGARIGVLFFLLFDLLEIANWLNLPAVAFLKTPGLINPVPWALWFCPRPSGMSLDPSRGGVLLAFYSFIILRCGNRPRLDTFLIYLGFFMLILTGSRSALIAYMLMMTVFNLQRFRLRRWPIIRIGAMIAVALLLFFCLANANVPNLNIGLLLTERTSFDPADSGGIHLSLIARAAEVADMSLKNMLIGIGFGNSLSVLENFFPGDKYANFHSMYLSIWVESGIVALLLLLTLSGLPFLRSGTYVPLLTMLIWFNIFYQLTLEPAFWLCLAMAWGNLQLQKSHSGKQMAVQS